MTGSTGSTGSAGSAGSTGVDRQLDLRLCPAAGLAWAVTVIGIQWGWRAAGGAALVLLVVAAAALRPGRARCVPVVAAALLGAGFAVAIGCHAYAVQHHPLAGRAGEVVRVSIVLTDDPRLLPGAGFGSPRVLVRARLVSVAQGGEVMRAPGAVTVLAPAREWVELLPGQQAEVRGTLLQPRRPDLTVATIGVDDPVQLVGEPPWWQRAAGSVRADFAAAAQQAVPGDRAALLPGLVIGDTSRIPAEVRAAFVAAGLSHLTAVSGANVSILVGAVLLLVRLATLGPRAGAAIAALALIAFVVLARPSPSVLRAALMGAVGLLALVTGRRRQALPALATAVIALLAIQPALAVDAGFALSVLATAGLIVLAPGWARRLVEAGWPRGLAEATGIAGAAFVVTTPVVVGLAGTVNPLSILANLLVAPVVAPVTVIGAAAAALSAVWLPAGVFLARFTGPMLWWLLEVADRVAAVPASALTPPGGAVAARVVVLVGLYLCRWRSVRRSLTAGLIGAASVLLPVQCGNPYWPPPGWALIACDVGQGDGVVLAAGDAGAVVVDAGPEPGPIRACLDRLGVHRIALVILTHLHADHIGGLAGVLRGRSVGAVAVSPAPAPASALRSVRATVTGQQVRLVELPVGRTFTVGSIRLQVLGPLLPAPRDSADADAAANDRSVVLGVGTTAGRILLAGDAEQAAQQALLRSAAPLRADVLKVPHHGSRTSSSEFFAAVRPRVVLISVGADNQFGHPDSTVVEELTRLGAVVRRTDRGGDIAVVGGDVPTVVTRRAGGDSALPAATRRIGE